MAESRRYESVDVEAASNLVNSQSHTLLDVRSGYKDSEIAGWGNRRRSDLFRPRGLNLTALLPRYIAICCDEERPHAVKHPGMQAETAAACGPRPSTSPLPRRTDEEFAAGHAPQALHIPFMIQTEEGRAYNDQFLQQAGIGGERAVRLTAPAERLLQGAHPSRQLPGSLAGFPAGCCVRRVLRTGGRAVSHADCFPAARLSVLQVRQAFPDKAAAHLCVTCGGGTRGTSAATVLAEEGYNVKCMPGKGGVRVRASAGWT